MHKSAHRRLRFAWLLLLVYVPMMIAVTLHHHGEAERAYAIVQCQDCTHHVHHSGHLMAIQHAMHDCVLCQLQSTPYLPSATLVIAAAAVPMRITRTDACAKCKLVAVSARSTRAPPYSCILYRFYY